MQKNRLDRSGQKVKSFYNGTGKNNQLRIIGGQWRGRKLKFADAPGLRPTMDRVRETLFNWLQPVICGASCLDLFAGSGALGLEALSRGAGEVIMIDKNRQATRMIEANLELLQVANARVLAEDASDFLSRKGIYDNYKTFDIVFIDPPFEQDLLNPFCQLLESGSWLKPGAKIYLEAERKLGKPHLPESWQLIKEKYTGDLGYYLAIKKTG